MMVLEVLVHIEVLDQAKEEEDSKGKISDKLRHVTTTSFESHLMMLK